MRREVLYLSDIVEAADDIHEFLTGIDLDDFLKNRILQSAVLQKLAIIGEAAAHLSSDFRNHHPDIEWSDIVAFRNIVVHAYFAIDWPIVWVAATQDAPELRARIDEILKNEYDSRQ